MGSIVADFITTGILNADLIRTGNIRNKSGSIEINLSSGNGIDFKKNGQKAISIVQQIIEFYDWQGTERKESVGDIYSTRISGNALQPGISVSHNKDALMTLAYFDKTTNTYKSYVNFDFYKLLGGKYDISVNNSIAFQSQVFLNGYLKGMGLKDGKNEENSFFASSDSQSWVTNKNLKVNGDLNVVGTITGNKTIESRIQALENLELERNGLI